MERCPRLSTSTATSNTSGPYLAHSGWGTPSSSGTTDTPAEHPASQRRKSASRSGRSVATRSTGPSQPAPRRRLNPSTKPARGPPPGGFSLKAGSPLLPGPTSTAISATSMSVRALRLASVAP